MSRNATRHFQGDRLREARRARSYTAEALARELDVTLRTIQRWEADGNGPSGADLVRLADVLGRRPDWFYGDHDTDGKGR
jgi:transcriptional regulator with XRE-family HTH domain